MMLLKRQIFYLHLRLILHLRNRCSFYSNRRLFALLTRSPAFWTCRRCSARRDGFLGDSIGDTKHAELIGDDLRRRALRTGFRLPLAGLDTAGDKDLVAFLHLLGDILGQCAPKDDVVKFCALFHFAALAVLPLFIAGHADGKDALSARGGAHLRVFRHIADNFRTVQAFAEFHSCRDGALPIFGVEQNHILRDKLGFAFLFATFFIVPGVRLKAATDEYLSAGAQILRSDFGHGSPHGNREEAFAGELLARTRGEGIRNDQVKIGDGRAAGSLTELYRLRLVSDEGYAIEREHGMKGKRIR